MLLNVYHEVYESFPKLEQRFCRWIFVEKKKIFHYNKIVTFLVSQN